MAFIVGSSWMTSPALAEQLIVDKNLDIKQNASRVHGVEGQDDLEVIYRGSPEIYGSLTVHGTFSWTGYLDVGAARSDDVAGSAYVTAKKLEAKSNAQLWVYNESENWRKATLSADEIDLSKAFTARVDKNTILKMRGRRDGEKTEVSLGVMWVRGGFMVIDGHGTAGDGTGIIFSSKTNDQGVFRAGSMTWEKGSKINVDDNAYGTVEITDANQLALA